MQLNHCLIKLESKHSKIKSTYHLICGYGNPTQIIDTCVMCHYFGREIWQILS